MAREQVTVARAVGLQCLRRDARDLGGLVEEHLARAELGRHQRQQAGAGADVGDRRLALDDHGGERLAEGLVAHAVGDQGAVVFNAHWLRSL